MGENETKLRNLTKFSLIFLFNEKIFFEKQSKFQKSGFPHENWISLVNLSHQMTFFVFFLVEKNTQNDGNCLRKAVKTRKVVLALFIGSIFRSLGSISKLFPSSLIRVRKLSTSYSTVATAALSSCSITWKNGILGV